MAAEFGAALSRRQFIGAAAVGLSALAVSGMGTLAAGAEGAGAMARDLADLDVTIDRVVRCEVRFRRPRFVAGNAGYRSAGRDRGDAVLLVFGSNGKIGVGACRGGAQAEAGRYLLGKRISDLLQNDAPAVNRGVGTSALWDLAGKTLDEPIYALLGGQRPAEGVGVYDGAIYHEELLPRDEGTAYRNPDAKYGRTPNWEDVIREAIDGSLAMGHRFVKVKIGRGHKHLSRLAGNYQDAAVLRLIRQHAGDDFGIGVDANNGYRLEDTLWLLREHGDIDLAFIEEMFEEDVEAYRQVRQVLEELKLRTLVADGENWSGPDDPQQARFIASGVVDVLQGDMRRYELEGIIQTARQAEQAGFGAKLAPHNWGSEFGFLMQIHAACAIPNFYRAEHDPGRPHDDTLIIHGYDIKDGRCHNFDAPGLGVELNPARLENLNAAWDVKA